MSLELYQCQPLIYISIIHPGCGHSTSWWVFCLLLLKAFVFLALGRGHKHSSRHWTINHWKGIGSCLVMWTMAAMYTILNEGNQTIDTVHIGAPPLSSGRQQWRPASVRSSICCLAQLQEGRWHDSQPGRQVTQKSSWNDWGSSVLGNVPQCTA